MSPCSKWISLVICVSNIVQCVDISLWLLCLYAQEKVLFSVKIKNDFWIEIIFKSINIFVTEAKHESF